MIFDESGREIKIDISKAHASNMMAPYAARQIQSSHKLEIKLPESITVEDGDYIAVAVNGDHGIECAYCAAIDKNSGKPVGFTGRATSYPVNNWEHIVCESGKNYTYYLALSKEDAGKEFVFYTLLTKPAGEVTVGRDVYFCKANKNREGIKLFI